MKIKLLKAETVATLEFPAKEALKASLKGLADMMDCSVTSDRSIIVRYKKDEEEGLYKIDAITEVKSDYEIMMYEAQEKIKNEQGE